jgi:hypothetical protein
MAGVTADTDSIRLQQRKNTGEIRAGQSEVCGAGCEFTTGIETNGGERIIANANSKRHEKCQPATFTDRQERQYRKTDITGQPGNWHNFPTQSPVRFRNDGLPSKLDGITIPKWRNESIKAAGNAIVPQVVYQIFMAINLFAKDYENV